ncbi:Inorganic phosphate transporter [Datura stramonium]|uniref:Inorganic phosphate transporter n=1 Tax=Datura stramonium TaxID=4076 RepID=A0ABS8SJN9_DATST|nr:Inorganic phosphate transporter [Datura stramonium]
MGKVLDIEIQAEGEKLAKFKAANEYPLLSDEFFARHGLHLIGTMSTWFLLTLLSYSQNLTQKDIFPTMGLVNNANSISALREMFETSRAMFVIALLGTFPVTGSQYSSSRKSGGAMVSAFGVQQYTQDGNVHKIKKAMMLLAFTNMVGFCCTFLVTETKGRSLEEISGEDEKQNETQTKSTRPVSGHQDDGWD